MSLQLTGIHHLTAVTAQARENLGFYTETMGMRLVKKTVNQDDVSSYHLFYADGAASPGTDLTFFDWPAPRERRGARSVSRTGLRVAGKTALEWWKTRLEKAGAKPSLLAERAGRLAFDFEDPEGQRFTLVDDGGKGEAHPWNDSSVPPERQIRGLGPISLSVSSLAPTDAVLTQVMAMRAAGEYREKSPDGETVVQVYEMGQGGAAAELHVTEQPDLSAARLGAGGVHHVAFRTPDVKEHDLWVRRLAEFGIGASGPVDRFYFRSLYFREPNGILFEIATDGPGFAVDEPQESLGGKLALPPFLEGRRKEIEAGLKPL